MYMGLWKLFNNIFNKNVPRKSVSWVCSSLFYISPFIVILRTVTYPFVKS